MDRRDAIKKSIVLAGGIVIAPELLAKALENPVPYLQAVPASRIALLAEMADTIIPDTDTPGAKAAKVEEFIVVTVEACLPPKQRDAFWMWLDAAEKQCISTYGRSYTACTTDERNSLMRSLEAMTKTAPPDQPAFFSMLKSMTMHGYFTSEIGATQALNYDPIPGQWIADMPIDGNTKAWTPMF